jgi:hypothetical protein
MFYFTFLYYITNINNKGLPAFVLLYFIINLGANQMKAAVYFISLILLTGLTVDSQTTNKCSISDAKENSTITNTKSPGTSNFPLQTDLVDPVGTVPTLTTYWDYVTNGNNLRRVWVFGDTVVVFADWTDSLNAQVTTSRKTRYNLSYDGGTTWDNIILTVNPLGCAYPDVSPVFTSVGRTVAVSGRRFVSGSVGYAGTDLLLGLGVFTEWLVPNSGRDYFSSKLSSSLLGGTFQRGDTLFYIPYNYLNNQFLQSQIMAAPPGSIDINARHYVTTSSDGQRVFVMWWVSTTGNVRMMGRESTNGGTTFGAEFTVLPYNTVIHGNHVSSWFGADLIYKPGTNIKCAAMNTLEIGNYGTAQGSKLLYWSPNINSGNPVCIADWTNLPVMADTFWYNVNLRYLQVGMTAASHPSLAYSSDGSVLLCVYSVIQSDTSYYGYHFNDIWFSYSYNDGATWSNPYNLTNTTNVDEIYPSISKTGNTVSGNSAYLNLTYLVSDFPGSASFTNLETPVSKNYHVFRKHYVYITNVSKISESLPGNYFLHQNYPNPFNPSTNIKLNIPKLSNVKLAVYDISGKKVTVLLDQILTPSEYKVVWDGSAYSSGVYFYRLETDGFIVSKKMILLK